VIPPAVFEAVHFLRAIAAAPADDTPRLVFADWLDEHDDPDWAGLIRLQCPSEFDGDYVRAARVLGRLHAHFPLRTWHLGFDPPADGWAGEPPTLRTWPARLGWVWVRRGFLAGVACPADQFLSADRLSLLALHPVADVRLYDRRPYTGTGGALWYPADAAGADHPVNAPHALPVPLYRRLPGATGVGGDGVTGYQTEARARAALLTACRRLLADIRDGGSLYETPAEARRRAVRDEIARRALGQPIGYRYTSLILDQVAASAAHRPRP
jgi:uncharacterized protein (TIGR02996 family)